MLLTSEDSVMMRRQMQKAVGPKDSSSFSWFPENEGNMFAVVPHVFTHSKGALQAMGLYPGISCAVYLKFMLAEWVCVVWS